MLLRSGMLSIPGQQPLGLHTSIRLCDSHGNLRGRVLGDPAVCKALPDPHEFVLEKRATDSDRCHAPKQTAQPLALVLWPHSRLTISMLQGAKHWASQCNPQGVSRCRLCIATIPSREPSYECLQAAYQFENLSHHKGRFPSHRGTGCLGSKVWDC